MRKSLMVIVLCPVLAMAVVAQPTAPANFNVGLHASGITASGETMAADAWGNVFILDHPTGGPFVGPDSITRVGVNGGVNAAYATGLGVASQVAFNPKDGKCYAAFHSPLLTIVMSTVYRFDNAGPVQVGTTPLIAAGFTIDDTGRWIFGTSTAVSGPGLYRHGFMSTPPTYLGSGFGSNAILQSVASSQDVLIAQGAEVRRWSPFLVGTLPYWSTLLIPNTIVRVTSLARSYYNQLGRGALIGVNSFTTLCSCGFGAAFPGSPTSGSNASFSTETFTFPRTGLRTVTTSIRGPMYWLTDAPPVSTGPGKTLFIVQEEHGPNIPSSLQVNVAASTTGSVVDIDVWGVPGAPLLLGVIPVPAITPWLEIYTSYGWISNIFDPTYIPVVDGAGVFGPPDPFGVIPSNGHWHLSLSLPPLGLQLSTQALIENSDAPNGWFNITNRLLVNLP
ncbi:MAG: hypothetical protein HRU14_01955 [Planctomycetes bacterium]|nr:hypothetical protein [Planctomycetota bacterium]